MSLDCIDKEAHWVMPAERKVNHSFNMALRGGAIIFRTVDDERYGLVARQKLTPYFATEPDEYRCKTNAYHYTLSKYEEDSEVISWQWHPTNPPHPHLHVAALDKHLHIPSGRVAFEKVVRFLIEDIEVLPARDDWDAVLAEQEARHEEFRNWA